MKIGLIVVGKTQDKAVAEVIADYSKRIERYSGFELIETTDDKLASRIEKFDRAFLLDEHGREYRSVEFADLVQKQMNAGSKSVAFVVGGPFGFSAEIRALPPVTRGGTIALSKMTFPHDLVRAIFLEQLYRAFTILRNEKYHHE
ncbi:MAG TPA: 23S rRNA (pseudouridine(1915)-N(3))-methyltransferase RlmH [Candidatus Paceibacterota bacterium]|nr:23S rRNA (pseudouridine(1915)-N(3))-methyltransferase RlmH [Candidatus Paceibacterota bacterium]